MILQLLAFVPLLGSPSQELFAPATPDSQGLDGQALQALAQVVKGYIDKDQAVGAELLVIQNRRTVLHEVFGMRDREQQQPWTKGTLSNIRSMSKPLTGAALQILIDRGEIGIDDLVAEYIEGFQNEACEEISIRQVLEHQAGLPLSILREKLDQYPSLIAMANAVGERGPEFPPGSRFWYSDAGTDVLGALVELISGSSLDEFIQTELLEPLGMQDSFYHLDDEDPRRANIASLYVGGLGSWGRFWAPASGAFYPYAWGSQSLYSTPLDYAKFLAMWMDQGLVGERQVLSKTAVQRSLRAAREMSMLGSSERFPTSFK